LQVGGPLLAKGLCAAGAIRLVGATIDESLDLNRAQLQGRDTGGKSLDAARMHVGGSALLSEGFMAAGDIVLLGATIASDLDLAGANLPGPERNKENNGKNKNCEYLFSLYGASCGELRIPAASPPPERHLELRSFRFDALGGHTSSDKQLEWIRHQGFKDSWSPDPYEQLATWYGRTGDETAARRIRVARGNDQLKHLRRTKPWRSLPYRLWRWPLRLLVGYGYRRSPAGLLLVVTLVGAGMLFLFAERDRAMVPNEPTTDAAGNRLPCGEAYPCFNSWMYGADVVLPIINFGQDDAWRPIETAHADQWWIRARWALIAIGWALASVFVAAFTALVQRT
jgi:hypothetical protein